MKRLSVVFVLVCAVVSLGQAPSKERVNKMYEAYEGEVVRRMDHHFHDGEYEECVSLLRIQKGIRPHDPSVAGQIVWMYGNLERDGDALHEAIRFRRSHPNDPFAAQNEAEVYYKATNKLYARIPPILEPFVGRQDTMQNLVMLCKAYEELGLISECMRIWKVRQKIWPNDLTVKANIARLEKKLKK